MEISSLTRFEQQQLDQFVQRSRDDLAAIVPKVKKIITEVRSKGDQALLDYSVKFDKVSMKKQDIRITSKEISDAYNSLTKEQIAALQEAAKNIARFHQEQKPQPWSNQPKDGITYGQIFRPLDSVGLYVPGGKAAYPSSVLMCALPAKIAGVERIIICTPPQGKEEIAPSILVAADIAGIEEIYRVGGAQAIAAMAYGTETIPKVHKIIGPGNKFVTAAKLGVQNDVVIDLPAGPSEILIIADENANPDYLAADLLAQMEHDEQAWGILISLSKSHAQTVLQKLLEQSNKATKEIDWQGRLKAQCLILVSETIAQAIAVSNRIAPEHLSLQFTTAENYLDNFTNAGAIFLGQLTPVAFGDYNAGLNHVLPTAGYAKNYSGLSTADFLKRINFLRCSATGCKVLSETAILLAEMEGLQAHANSVKIRLGGLEANEKSNNKKND
jgi:histidinol dehydrogenase